MQYFTNEYILFFKELSANNNKEWFHENKKRYEIHVRKPMISLVTDVITEMQKIDSAFDPIPHKCLGRINRDIRFAKDKTPYNHHFFAHITKGTKENSLPGIAFQFGADDAGIMTGYYKPTKEKLIDIKDKIQSKLNEFQKLKTDVSFVEKFGEIKGEAYKRIPSEYQSTFEKEPLIANKQYYYVKEFDASFVTSSTLKEEIISYWLAAKPMNDFLE